MSILINPSLYLQICEWLRSGEATRYWDPVQKVPHLVFGDQWVGYDDKESLTEKVGIINIILKVMNEIDFHFLNVTLTKKYIITFREILNPIAAW